jgi:hypothetical protein
LEKDAEILSVGKIAESARFAEEEDLSLKTAICLIERQRVIKGRLLDKLALTRGRVPLIIKCTEGDFNVSRFVMRAVPLWGESQVSNDFPKIVDKAPDDRDGIMTNRWWDEMMVSLMPLWYYQPSLSALRFEDGDLHGRLLR